MIWVWFIIYCIYAVVQAIFVCRQQGFSEEDDPTFFVILAAILAPFVSFYVLCYILDKAIKKAVVKNKG